VLLKSGSRLAGCSPFSNHHMVATLHSFPQRATKPLLPQVQRLFLWAHALGSSRQLGDTVRGRTKYCLFGCYNLRQSRMRIEESVMLRFTLILFAIILGSSPSHSQMAMPTLRGDDLPGPLLVQEPYCEMGNGPCGGACNAEGKQPWDCPDDALPCYQRGQRCTCETADMCKPKKKKKSELSHPPASSAQASLLAR